MEILSQGFNPHMPHAVFEISCNDCDSLEDLFRLAASILSFPSYFWIGNRWDSLVDCLMDLSWIESDSIIIRFAGFQSMRMLLTPEESNDFIETMQFVAHHCHQHKPLHKQFRIVID